MSFIASTSLRYWAASAVAAVAASSVPDLPSAGIGSSVVTGGSIPHSATLADSPMDDTGIPPGQESLAGLKTWIVERPEFASAGYIDQINWHEEARVTVLWDADMWSGSDVLRDKLAQEAARRSIKVDFQQRALGLQDIEDAADEIFDESEALAEMGFDVEAVSGVRIEDGPLEVIGTFTQEPQGSRIPAAEGAGTPSMETAQDVEGLIRERLGIQVEAVEGDVEPARSRAADTSPFFAGGQMRRDGGGICSSGFSLWVGSTSHTTTARHCNGTFRAYSRPSSVYGSSYRTSSDGAARMLTGRGATRMFDGSWSNPDGYSKAVNGFFDVSLNDRVCTSGANSGVHCPIKVTEMSRFWKEEGVSTIIGVKEGSGIAAIQGDSGGPVLVPLSNGKVGAVGMIQAINSPGMTGSSCGSVRVAGSNQCSKTVWFTSMRTIANSFGVRLVTG